MAAECLRSCSAGAGQTGRSPNRPRGGVHAAVRAPGIGRRLLRPERWSTHITGTLSKCHEIDHRTAYGADRPQCALSLKDVEWKGISCRIGTELDR
jgi:hypothetical protein